MEWTELIREREKGGTRDEADLRFLTWVNIFHYTCDMILKGVEGKVKVAGMSVYYMLSVTLWRHFIHELLSEVFSIPS